MLCVVRSQLKIVQELQIRFLFTSTLYDTCHYLQRDLGDRLLPCFDSASHVPYSDVNLKTGKAHPPKWGPDSSTSEVTTIQLEFRDLSRVTGDPKYEVSILRHNWCCHLNPFPNKCFENSAGKGEIAHHEQVLLFLQCFLPI